MIAIGQDGKDIVEAGCVEICDANARVLPGLVDMVIERVGSSSTVGPTAAPSGAKAPQFSKIVPNTVLGRI